MKEQTADVYKDKHLMGSGPVMQTDKPLQQSCASLTDLVSHMLVFLVVDIST
jgi:hypothetical protein